MRLAITLKNLEKKHAQVRENFKREQVNSCALSNQVRALQDSIKGKETGEFNPQRNLIEELQKEVESLKRKISIPASHHVQIAKLAQAEKDKTDLVDSLAKEKEEK